MYFWYMDKTMVDKTKQVKRCTYRDLTGCLYIICWIFARITMVWF